MSGGALRLRRPDPVPLAEILALDRPALLALWQRRFGCTAPRNVSLGFLQRALGHAAQIDEEGDVPPRAIKALTSIAAGKVAAAGSAAALRPGVCLMRDWNGRTYRVEVIAAGFQMDGKCYRSLSAIARRITGVRWSGPRFFGIG
ncbi:MAG: DUF2924 domain-containing protein [Paracoccaceae bacterium]